jgi:hypothetical protein
MSDQEKLELEIGYKIFNLLLIKPTISGKVQTSRGAMTLKELGAHVIEIIEIEKS